MPRAQLRASLEGLEAEEAGVLQADAILKALSVESEADVRALLALFFDDSVAAGQDAEELQYLRINDPVEFERRTLGNLGLRVRPDDVVRVIKRFVDQRDATRRTELESRSAKRAVNAADGAESADARRERGRREEREFWERLAGALSPADYRMWGSLERALHGYNGLLKERRGLVEDVQGLQGQNHELKALLHQYLGARVNEQLQIPPTQIIRIDAATAQRL